MTADKDQKKGSNKKGKDKKSKDSKSKKKEKRSEEEEQQPQANGIIDTGSDTKSSTEKDPPRKPSPPSSDYASTSGYNSRATSRLAPSTLSSGSVSLASLRSAGSKSSTSSFNLSREWDVSSSKLKTRSELELVFLDPLDKKYECPVCCQVLRYPVQFEDCGHRCCSSCLPELLRIAPRCPIDQSRVERDKVYVDKAFQRELDTLAVKCSNFATGCDWNGTLREHTSHQEECEHTMVLCPKGCDAEFEKRFLDTHIKEDCPRRRIECEFCQKTIRYFEEIDHLNICDKFPVSCPNGCKKKEIPRGELTHHMEKECNKQGISCPFAEAGCDHTCERKKMKDHIKNEPEKHLDLVSQALVTYKRTLEIHDKTMSQQNDRLVSIETKVEGLEKLYGSQLVWKIEDYKDRLADGKAGRKTTIYSPPFLTSRHGYKMALSACLYGDGKARGSHMSLFVCICKGEYDPLLVWPFSHRITFTLIDQCQDPAGRRNVTYTVKPNTCKENRPFLGRPKGERNASFGAQKFVELDILGTLDYIRDDIMFIKVSIDSEDMVLL